jgi:hypothetical protein
VSLLSVLLLELPNSLLAGAMMGRPRAAALQARIDEHLQQVRIDSTAAALVSVSLLSALLLELPNSLLAGGRCGVHGTVESRDGSLPVLVVSTARPTGATALGVQVTDSAACVARLPG